MLARLKSAILGLPDAAKPRRVVYRAQKSSAALVFVHGFSGDANNTWSTFTDLLLNEPTVRKWDVFGLGYPSSLRVDIPRVWSADPDIDILSLGLKTTLSLEPFRSYPRLAICAHSMGGLVVQGAVTSDETLIQRLSHLFMFGTPSAGLRKALLFRRLKRQIRDMAPNSRFIETTRHQWQKRFNNGTPFLMRVIAGDRDEFVPPDSSIIPFPASLRRVVPGNHVQIVRPTDPQHESFRIVVESLCGQSPARPAVESALIAAEIGEFEQAINTLLPRAKEIDDNALASLALALESVGRSGEALDVLDAHLDQKESSTDALGILAGRLKRRWLVQRAKKDFVRSRELYAIALARAEAANDHQQAFYHAINVAFLDLMNEPPDSPPSSSVLDYARRALNHCTNAAETNWRLATEGEALMILGDLESAVEKYAEAIKRTTSPRQLDSMYSQAIRVAARVHTEKGAGSIKALFGLSI